MKINEKVTVNFTEDDLKEIISMYCKTKGYDVDSIVFNVKSGVRCEGFGQMEHDVHYVGFNGATVTMK